MPNRSIHQSIAVKLLAATTTGTGAVTSASVDLQGYDACCFNIHYGATAPTPTSISVEESDDNSAWAAAAAADVINDGGTHAVSTTRRLSYIGAKRYSRLVVTPNGSTTLTISAVLGNPDRRPVTNPV